VEHKRRILIISNSFYPVVSPRSYRATELAKEFAGRGCAVKIITSFKDGVDYEKLASTFKVQFRNFGKGKFKILKQEGSKFRILFVRLVNRLLQMLLEYPDIQIMPLVVKALADEEGYDLMVSLAVPYPVHWGVARARTSKHRIAGKWVADCGDPYMGDRIDTFRKLFYFRYIEKWFCRKVDYLTVPTKNSIKGYYKEFHEKIRVIPQGFNLNEVTLPVVEPYNEPVRFAYAGNIIPVNRDPRPFLEYLSTLDINFLFIFYTRKAGLIKEYKEKLKEKLEIKDYIPRHELLPVLASMDFLVNFDNNTEVHTPSKLIDYAIVKRPVLNITSTIDKSLVTAFLARDYKDAYVIDNIDQYDIKDVAGKFLKLI